MFLNLYGGRKMTSAYRRQEVLKKEPSLNDFKDRWPALIYQREINAGFQRLMAVPLEEKFMAQLDMHSSELISVIHSKTDDTHLRRECLLKALIIFLGEDADDLIKECLDSCRS
ncbi:unnamed protein product [Pleuronectes platessa]|uniref:Uncharacterized protein n=1 Tax=Pleuronectes platessa TaxID=8262 RepID=A0A9N7UHR7_PLEPL|nr:unnamed protein product [Pleuronectes platessa]